MDYFLGALQFLTSIPIRLKNENVYKNFGRIGIWFPFVGFLIGLCVFVSLVLAQLIFPQIIAVLIAEIVWVSLTGALHLDGLSDCCDGLIPPVSSERALEIMKDSRIGSFGAVGLVLYLLLKICALYYLIIDGKILFLLLAPVVARWLVLWVARLPNARPGGMGDSFSKGITSSVLLFASVLPVALIFYFGLPAALTTLFAASILCCLVWFVFKKIKGVTGDVFGMTIEAVELLVILGFIINI